MTTALLLLLDAVAAGCIKASSPSSSPSFIKSSSALKSGAAAAGVAVFAVVTEAVFFPDELVASDPVALRLVRSADARLCRDDDEGLLLLELALALPIAFTRRHVSSENTTKPQNVRSGNSLFNELAMYARSNPGKTAPGAKTYKSKALELPRFPTLKRADRLRPSKQRFMRS